MKNKKKIKQFQLLLTAVFTLVAIILVFFDDADDVWLIVRRINMVYLGAIIVLSFLYHGLVALTLTKLTKSVVPEYTYRKGFINAMIAAFFHGVTPGASGGQVAQLYVFNKQGVSSSEATSILLIEFLVYQTAMIFVSLGL